jgi:hypothetical protein
MGMSINTIAQKTNQGITNSREFIDNKVDSILSPKGAEGISGWIFDINQRENLSMEADITDHVIESGSFISDHIVRKPVVITLSGFKGELLFEKPHGVAGALQELSNKLEVVDAYLGDYTPGMVQKIQGAVSKSQEVASQINNTLDKVQNVVGFFEGDDFRRTKQQIAYAELYALYYSTTVLTVQTPWKYFDSMLIQSLSFSQDEETDQWSEITVTLKEVKFSNVKVTEFNEDLIPVRSDVQSAEAQDNGIVSGKTGELISSLFTIVVGE